MRPFTIEVYWTDGHTSQRQCSSRSEAEDFLRYGIAWGNPAILSARLYGDNGEPLALESADTITGRRQR